MSAVDFAIDVDEALLDQIQSQLDLRQPNREAVETIAIRLRDHYGNGAVDSFEGVVDAATGVGKTFILAGAIDYFAALGWRNFAVIAPGTTILNKTIAQFSRDTPKSLLDGMSVEPLVVHSDNFRSASVAAQLENQDRVKLFVFSVQSMTKPTTKQGRKTHSFQEGLGKAFYDHLDDLADLIVFADEHHSYHGPKFSEAIRELTPYALIGLTATPNETKLEKEGTPIIYRYPLSAAIADELVKTPVIVGRKDDRVDERTQMLDGAALLDAKERSLKVYCERNGVDFIHPVMLVNCKDIEHAQETVAFIRSDQFYGGQYDQEGAVLEVHSKATAEEKERTLAALDTVEEVGSPTRIIVQVGMLQEGWDVKNVYVIVSLRASVSAVLTEQTLGRGLRLPFGHYVEMPLLNELEVVAHERYEQLLSRSKILTEQFIDQRTYLAERQLSNGQMGPVIEEKSVQTPVVAEGEEGPQAGAVTLSSTEQRKAEAEAQAKEAEVPLKPLRDLGEIQVPDVRTEIRAHEFELKDVTDLVPFREMGRKLAVDPEKHLRRVRLGAEIHEDHISHERLIHTRTAEATEKIEAVQVKVPEAEARKQIAERIAASRFVPTARGKPRAQINRLLDAVLDGASDKADLLLSHYPDRLADEMIAEIIDAKRGLDQKTETQAVLAWTPFSAKTRSQRPNPSGDLHGAFKKGQAYVGWKRGLYEQAWFDSKPERTMATILDSTEDIDVWARLELNDVPISWNAGDQTYNPDLLAVDKKGNYWLIETKSDKDMSSDEVQGKRRAAVAWTNLVNEESEATWTYLLVAERDLKAAKDSWTAIARATSP